MRLGKLGLGTALALVLSSSAQAAILVQYNAAGASGTAGSEPAFLNATSASSPDVTPSTLIRGTGLDTANLANGFSADFWDPTNTTLADAVVAGDYFQWAFTVNNGVEADITSFDATLRRSATNGPSTFYLQYSFDNFATPGATGATFQYLGRSSGTAGATTPFQWMTTDTPGQNDGNRISTQDLSDIAALQDIEGGQTVTFRLYGHGTGTGGATSNTVALGRNPALDNGNGEAGAQINGEITAIPEPALGGIVGAVMLVVMTRRNRKA